VRLKPSASQAPSISFTDQEIGILREVLGKMRGDDGWVPLPALSKELRDDERWKFERHKGKLGKSLRKLAFVEFDPSDSQRVRVSG
jgi:hypothetical protein